MLPGMRLFLGRWIEEQERSRRATARHVRELVVAVEIEVKPEVLHERSVIAARFRKVGNVQTDVTEHPNRLPEVGGRGQCERERGDARRLRNESVNRRR